MALGKDLEQNQTPSHDKSVNDTQKHVLWVVRPLLGSVLQALMTGAVLAFFLPLMSKMHANQSGQLVAPENQHMHVFVTTAANGTEETHHRIAFAKRVNAQTIIIQTVSGHIFAVGPKSYLQIGSSKDENVNPRRLSKVCKTPQEHGCIRQEDLGHICQTPQDRGCIRQEDLVLSPGSTAPATVDPETTIQYASKNQVHAQATILAQQLEFAIKAAATKAGTVGAPLKKRFHDAQRDIHAIQEVFKEVAMDEYCASPESLDVWQACSLMGLTNTAPIFAVQVKK